MDPTRTQTAEVGLDSAAAAAPTLTVIYHPDEAVIGACVVVPAQRELTFGRAHDGGLPGVFGGHRVSRAHARVTRVGRDGAEIVDLGSRNGTFVDGQQITRALLVPGALVALGDVLLRYEHGAPRVPTPPDPEIAGASAAIAQVLADVALVAARDTAVAIIGETGTGKELVARALHRASGRGGRLVSVNCGGVPDTLLASELFGHRRGAFTGADRERTGLVAQARGGTLFLDEVADASPTLQAALLRLMEARRFRPVGADHELDTDARFVVACQPSIDARVDAGSFRLDLWNRAARWVIEVPALRERRDDIPLLALRFARELSHDAELTLAEPLLLALLAHDWPGNVRELRNVVERAVVEARGERPVALSPRLAALLAGARAACPPSAAAPTAPASSRRSPTPRPSREALVAGLARHDGNVRALADELGVMRRTVYRWFAALAIDVDAVREDAR